MSILGIHCYTRDPNWLRYSWTLRGISGIRYHHTCLVCSDLDAHTPPDFKSNPSNFVSDIKDEEVKAWALGLHRLWLQLCRKVLLKEISGPL